MDPRLITAIIVVVGVPATVIGYVFLVEQVLRLVPGKRQAAVRPWLWLLPALLFLFVFLVYPTINTIVLSFENKFQKDFVGLDNYVYFFTNPNTLISLRNNIIWLVLLTFLTVGGGLIIAILVDRVRYESIAKSVVFVPLAISFVGAAIIWKFMYDYQPPGHRPDRLAQRRRSPALGCEPITWIQDAPLNTIALIVVAAWTWTGFCMVILSAALKGISAELLEAARVDGANEIQVFRGITFPLLLPTIAVVVDDDDHHGAQGVRHRVRHDQRQLRHQRHRQPDVQGAVHQLASLVGPAPSR